MFCLELVANVDAAGGLVLAARAPDDRAVAGIADHARVVGDRPGEPVRGELPVDVERQAHVLPAGIRVELPQTAARRLARADAEVLVHVIGAGVVGEDARAETHRLAQAHLVVHSRLKPLVGVRNIGGAGQVESHAYATRAARAAAN